MQDHYVARVSYPVVGPHTANERSRRLPLAGEVMRWLITGKGMLTYSPSIVAASVKVLEARKACRACRFKPTTNSSTTPGATAAPAITPAALPAGVGLCDLLPERRCATM